MGLFDKIKDTLIERAEAGDAAMGASIRPSEGIPTRTEAYPGTMNEAAPSPAANGPVEVRAVLAQLAQNHPDARDWNSSIVDVLKLLGLDSGQRQCVQLAHELGYPGSTDDSTAMSAWLHREVMTRLAKRGEIVPKEWTHSG